MHSIVPFSNNTLSSATSSTAAPYSPQDLPPEILHKLFQFANGFERKAVQLVCKTFYEAEKIETNKILHQLRAFACEVGKNLEIEGSSPNSPLGIFHKKISSHLATTLSRFSVIEGRVFKEILELQPEVFTHLLDSFQINLHLDQKPIDHLKLNQAHELLHHQDEAHIILIRAQLYKLFLTDFNHEPLVQITLLSIIMDLAREKKFYLAKSIFHSIKNVKLQDSFAKLFSSTVLLEAHPHDAREIAEHISNPISKYEALDTIWRYFLADSHYKEALEIVNDYIHLPELVGDPDMKYLSKFISISSTLASLGKWDLAFECLSRVTNEELQKSAFEDLLLIALESNPLEEYGWVHGHAAAMILKAALCMIMDNNVVQAREYLSHVRNRGPRNSMLRQIEILHLIGEERNQEAQELLSHMELPEQKICCALIVLYFYKNNDEANASHYLTKYKHI